jgi:hypothetical protein
MTLAIKLIIGVPLVIGVLYVVWLVIYDTRPPKAYRDNIRFGKKMYTGPERREVWSDTEAHTSLKRRSTDRNRVPTLKAPKKRP